MTANKLGSRMNHNICSMLKWTNQVWSTKGIVHYYWQAMLVSQLRDSINIWNITIWIAQGLQIYSLGIRLNSSLDFLQIVGIYKGGFNAVMRQSMSQQVEAAAINGLLGYNVLTSTSQSLNSIVNSSRTRSYSQSSRATLQSCNTLLQNILSGIGQTSIDITSIPQAESVCCMSGISEYIGSSLINRHRSRIGSRIRLLLPNM